MSADTLKSSKNVISGEDHASEWSLKVKESFHRLTRDRDAILVAKFPKVN